MSEKLFFLKQHNTIGNACGTIATVHALANCGLSEPFVLKDGALTDFISKCSDKSPDEVGWSLIDCEVYFYFLYVLVSCLI